MKFRISEGEDLPNGFGIAWYDVHYQGYVILPYPFNYVAGAIVDAYWRMRHGWKPAAETEAYRAAYKNAAEAAWKALEIQRMEIKLEGWREGYKRAWDQIEEMAKGPVTVTADAEKVH